MTLPKYWVGIAVAVLLAVQAAQVMYVVHRESLTFDEGDHMFAGYMMWKAGDYGLNPEHPPLVKLLATLPLVGSNLWVPPAQKRDFKAEAYLNGRDWLAHNDGASQRLVFRMRLFAGLLAIALSLVIFFAAREWFGTTAALIALTLATFDPNILAHSALVTTDVGVSLFFLAGVYTFYRYVKQPSAPRLLLAGVAAGLLFATKHSGILLVPMLALLILWEVAFAQKGSRGRVAARLIGALAAIGAVAVIVLWAFYGFRYSAQPAGMKWSTTLAEYVRPLGHFSQAVVLAAGRFRLLPESYLVGLADVKRMAQFYPTFLFGKVYAHGQWWYFPAVIVIKTTLGLLALVLVASFGFVTGHLRKGRELAYVLLPWIVYLGVAMASGMNIGARHILPLYTLAAILAGGGLAALWTRNKIWVWIGAALMVAHIASSLAVFPNYMAYANEAWGGANNVHNLLSDANVDWAQQLYQVKAWQDRHPGEECWFAYFARPEIDPAVYGITCHAMPTIDTFWLGGSDIVPPRIHGSVLISAGDLSGCEWPSGLVNPYRKFQAIEPTETIDHAVFVYSGDFDMAQAAALSRAQNAYRLLGQRQVREALALVQEAAAIDPQEVISQTALGDILAIVGQKDEARKAWQTAIESARRMDPDAQVSYIPDLEAKLKRL